MELGHNSIRMRHKLSAGVKISPRGNNYRSRGGHPKKLKNIFPKNLTVHKMNH